MTTLVPLHDFSSHSAFSRSACVFCQVAFLIFDWNLAETQAIYSACPQHPWRTGRIVRGIFACHLSFKRAAFQLDLSLLQASSVRRTPRLACASRRRVDVRSSVPPPDNDHSSRTLSRTRTPLPVSRSYMSSARTGRSFLLVLLAR